MKYSLQSWDWYDNIWREEKIFFFKRSACLGATLRSISSKHSDRWRVVRKKDGEIIIEVSGSRDVSRWAIYYARDNAAVWEVRYNKILIEKINDEEKNSKKLQEYKDAIKILTKELSVFLNKKDG